MTQTEKIEHQVTRSTENWHTTPTQNWTIQDVLDWYKHIDYKTDRVLQNQTDGVHLLDGWNYTKMFQRLLQQVFVETNPVPDGDIHQWDCYQMARWFLEQYPDHHVSYVGLGIIRRRLDGQRLSGNFFGQLSNLCGTTVDRKQVHDVFQQLVGCYRKDIRTWNDTDVKQWFGTYGLDVNDDLDGMGLLSACFTKFEGIEMSDSMRDVLVVDVMTLFKRDCQWIKTVGFVDRCKDAYGCQKWTNMDLANWFVAQHDSVQVQVMALFILENGYTGLDIDRLMTPDAWHGDWSTHWPTSNIDVAVKTVKMLRFETLEWMWTNAVQKIESLTEDDVLPVLFIFVMVLLRLVLQMELMNEPGVVEPIVIEPSVIEPIVIEPIVIEPIVIEPVDGTVVHELFRMDVMGYKFQLIYQD